LIAYHRVHFRELEFVLTLLKMMRVCIKRGKRSFRRFRMWQLRTCNRKEHGGKKLLFTSLRTTSHGVQFIGNQAYSNFTSSLFLFQWLPLCQHPNSLYYWIGFGILSPFYLNGLSNFVCVNLYFICTDCISSYFLISSFLIWSSLVHLLTLLT
jgi:hypothetical protein